jgi:hypothetical protein
MAHFELIRRVYVEQVVLVEAEDLDQALSLAETPTNGTVQHAQVMDVERVELSPQIHG